LFDNADEKSSSLNFFLSYFHGTPVNCPITKTECFLYADLFQQIDTSCLEPPSVIYGKRKTIVELVFGQIKNSGFRGFSVRGKEKVAGEFSMYCAAYNIKKMLRPLLGD
jgi:hypothetical protein